MCPQEKLKENRSTAYSDWHRSPNLPYWCYITDGDCFEQRKVIGKLRTVAYIETIEVKDKNFNKYVDKNFPVWNSKLSLCRELHEKMKIPVYMGQGTDYEEQCPVCQGGRA